MTKVKQFSGSRIAFACTLFICATATSADLDYYKLAPGFVAEKKNALGFAVGYSAPNRWGEYTAYLMATNASGQRTWRIEQYQELPGAGFWQGSSMYLLEGARQALLIDTAQPSKNKAGVNDLKTVVRYLLGHENSGGAISKPLDFVVANTHGHPDHIGENASMSDRTVYYMDGDWPQGAPPNYVPVREGGGPTKNGDGIAVGEIELGNRMIRAVALPPHTPGSTAYLDAANKMLISGDAMGSGWPWLHWAAISEYADAMDHIAAITADIPDIAVLPAHFYQIDAYDRHDGPLGRQYILDQQASAHGIVSGVLEGEPYFVVGPPVYWGGTGSARLTYSLAQVDARNTTPAVNYRAVRIPGTSWKREWVRDPAQAKVFNIRSEMHLIRSGSGDVLYLLAGSRAALLIGSGTGAPGIAELVKRLAGSRPLEVVKLSNQPSQTGGLKLLATAKHRNLADGATIDLGMDGGGGHVRLEAQEIGAGNFTLLSVGDRTLFAPGTAAIQSASPAWRKKTDGRYDLVYTATSDQWMSPPDATATKQ
jgi:glyoxylase-like metal-dependent hydrolase (beta-lactamase superfamily II)